MSGPEAGEGLFGLEQLNLGPHTIGRAEAALHHAIAAGTKDGTLTDTDAALAAAALVQARALDLGDRMVTRGDKGGGYLIAQSAPGYLEALHALRLPTAIAPGPVPLPAGAAGDRPQWLDELGDAFGPAAG